MGEQPMQMRADRDGLARHIEDKIGRTDAWILVRFPLRENDEAFPDRLVFSLHGTPENPAEHLMALEGVVQALRASFHRQGVCPDDATEALLKTINEDLGRA